MSKRTDKKKQKRINEVHTTAAPVAQPAVEAAAPVTATPEATVAETATPVVTAPAYDLFITRTVNIMLLYWQKRFRRNAKLKVWTVPILRFM